MTRRCLSLMLMLLGLVSVGCSHVTTDVASTIDGEQPSSALYLPENVDSWVARWDIISKAEQSIDLTYFIIHDDIFGMSLLGLLHHKAKQGVNVRLMLDSRGSYLLSRSGFGADILQELLLTKNAEVRIYNPLERQLAQALLFRGMRTVVASNHDKIVIVDKEIAIVGGRNISRDYLASHQDHPGAWFDADVMIRGGSVKGVQRAFDVEYNANKTMRLASEIINLNNRSDELEWSYRVMDWVLNLPSLSPRDRAQSRQEQALRLEGSIIGPRAEIPSARARRILKGLTTDIVGYPNLRGVLPRKWKFVPATIDIADSRSLQNKRGGKQNEVNLTMAQLVQRAQRDISFVTPYFVPTKDAVTILQRAHDRGVEITIYTNSPVSSDSKISQSAFMRSWPHILEKMPNLRLYVHGQPRLMHAKLATVDQAIAVVGSYNLDLLSAFVNGEVIAVIRSEELSEEVNRQVQQWIDRGPPVTYRYELERDAEGIAKRDDKGALIVKFGPKNHASKECLEGYARTTRMLSDRPATADSPAEFPDHLEAFAEELNHSSNAEDAHASDEHDAEEGEAD